MQTRNIEIIAAVAVVGLLLVTFLGGGMMGPGMMGWYGWGNQTMGPWWGIGMALFWIAVLAGLVGFVVWLVRAGSPAAAASGGPSSRAEELLKERYARGELTREEYERMRQDLRGG